MSSRKEHKSVLDNLKSDEAATVLKHLLTAHPNLENEAEHIAMALISAVSFEEIADDVETALRTPDMDDLNNRAGSHSWGYTEPTEAAWELLEEEIDLFLEEMKRHLKLGLQKEALEVCKGILLGLYRCRQGKDNELLNWAPDFSEETAHYILEEWKNGRKKTSFPQDFVDRFIPDWASLVKSVL